LLGEFKKKEKEKKKQKEKKNKKKKKKRKKTRAATYLKHVALVDLQDLLSGFLSTLQQ
jgi:hypothetical protein